MDQRNGDPNKEKAQLLTQLKTNFNSGNYDKCQTLFQEVNPLYQLSLDFLLIKMKTLEKLGKLEEALNTCNMILFLQPSNNECHQMKISILKNMQQYYYLSESLVQALKFHPHLSFN